MFDALRSSVIGGECFDEVEIVALQQLPKVARTPLDIRLWVKCILHPQLRCGLGHELHQSLCAFG